MKSLHKSNETPHDMAPMSITSRTFETVSITTSTGTSYSVTNNEFYMKHSVALVGLNKLETQSMTPDIVESPNVFHA